MTTAPLLRPDTKFRIVILNGPDKGTAYKLLSAEVSIGRGLDNDIVLNDPKCSRKHALLEIRNGAIGVTDISHKNMIVVDSQKFSQTSLTNGSVFTVGNTNIRVELVPDSDFTKTRSEGTLTAAVSPVPFSTPQIPPQRPAAVNPIHSAPTAIHPHPGPRRQVPPVPRNLRPARKKRSLTFYIIVGAVIALVVLLLSTKARKKAQEVPIQSPQQVESTIKQFEKQNQELLKEHSLTPQQQQARIYYLEGFRDFQDGQYGPAIVELRASLSMDPNYDLAARYLQMAQTQQDRMIQENMIAGRQYRDRGMYSLCVASFDVVMTTINDPNNLTYQEAKAIHDQCKLELEGNF